MKKLFNLNKNYSILMLYFPFFNCKLYHYFGRKNVGLLFDKYLIFHN